MKKEIPAVVYPGVVYAHYETKKIIGEQFIGEYGVCYIISGILKVTDAGPCYYTYTVYLRGF